jgi:serine-threonine kinase receptor-associated protein
MSKLPVPSRHRLINNRRVWDTHSGEEICALQHEHIVRAVAFPPNASNLLATGGTEKKLRLFDLDDVRSSTDNVSAAAQGIEVGKGVHKGTIKAIVWTHDPNTLVTVADDKVIRWWDLRNQAVVEEQVVQGEIGSCEFSNVKSEQDDIGSGHPVLTIVAGRSVYFYGGLNARTHLKTLTFAFDVASAALHPSQRKVVVGGMKDTWAKVYDYDSEQELGKFTFPRFIAFLTASDVHKGHHGPIWSISFSPDGKLYATGSEDGTIKMWKNCEGPYGLWRADRE